MKIFAEMKNGVRVAIQSIKPTNRVNQFPGGSVNHGWTNRFMVRSAAKELGVKPKMISCIVETI